MRVKFLMAGFLLACAMVSAPAMAGDKHGEKFQARADCAVCACPPRRSAHHYYTRHAARPAIHPVDRDFAETDDQSASASYYDYHSASTVTTNDWHGEWRRAPNDGQVEDEAADYGSGDYYGGYYNGAVADGSFNGGVGYSADGGGFMDGYGQMHYAGGGGVENGPTYNSYGQSFQFNPSMAHMSSHMGGGFPHH